MKTKITREDLPAEHLESLMYQAPAGFLLVNQDGRIQFINRLVEKMFNYRKEELIGQPVEMLIPERFRQEHVNQRTGFIKAPSARKMGKGRNLYAKAKDGREFPVEVGLGYSHGQEGVLVSAVIVDISRQLEVEREREDLIAKLKEALSTVKKLSGLLPICAGCKKIRDDTGYWNRIEAYIREHSEADFSHGICPDCAEKLYPDLDIYGDQK